MHCTNCGAAVPPKEQESARTCYACGEILYRGHEEASNVTPIFASEEEVRGSADRHPTTRASRTPTRAIADEYYQVTGNIGGKKTTYWVEASSDTSARDKYCTYVKEQGWKLFDRQGLYKWSKDPSERHPAKRRSLDVSGPTRDEPAEYLYRVTSKSPLLLGRRERA